MFLPTPHKHRPAPRAIARAALVLAMAAALGACTDMDYHSTPAQTSGPALAAPDVTSLRLAEAAEKAASALTALSRVEQTKTPTAPAEDFSSAPAELQVPTTLSWSGPIEPVLQMLAQRAGYRLRVMGQEPPAPVVVSVDEYDQPLIKLIRTVAVEAGTRADVVLDARQRLIQVRYASAYGR